MTEKIYDFDSYIKEFDGVVTDCKKTDKGYEIILDRTAFFPEEGGQCSDKGILNGIPVTDVQIRNDIIYHLCSEAIPVGTKIKGSIDFNLRFRNMQNHTGEHIICGIAHKLYGYENTGFHLGEDFVTMDLSGPLTKEQTEDLELRANRAVFENHKVKAYYPPENELDSIPYRSKDGIEGKIRIVEIEDCDICACCAPHVNYTGETGLIKIIDFFPHRGGTRLFILCGYDALEDYKCRFKESLVVSKLLSVKQHEISNGVQKLLDDFGKAKQKLSQKSKSYAMSLIENTKESDSNVLIFENDLDSDSMRHLANEGMKKTKRIFGILCGNDTDGYRYILSSQSINLKSISKDINSVLHGKGGGTETMISGVFKETKEKIAMYLK